MVQKKFIDSRENSNIQDQTLSDLGQSFHYEATEMQEKED